MNISAYSQANIMATFAKWDVPQDFADPMYNYLVHGYSPGSCFTAVLANDFLRAVSCSHPSNTINSFKALAGWINDHCPKQAFGNYEAVKFWLDITDSERRDYLERLRLIHTEKEDTWLNLKGDPVNEPILY
jgi:hypothetical protein